jgi:hypothetical protein
VTSDPLASSITADVVADEGRLTPAAPERARRGWRIPMRLAPGLSAMPAPPSVFLVAGLALGPGGLNLLSPHVLSILDPVVSVALAAIGSLVGMELSLRRSYVRALGGAALQASVTAAVIMLAFTAVSPAAEGFASAALLGLLLGLAGASSATPLPAPEVADRDSMADRIGGFGDVVPIVAGGAALAWLAEASVASAAWLLLLTIAVFAATAFAGWLLVSDTASDAEQRVFAVGAMLLLAGTAAFLFSSALLAGFVGGILWRTAGAPGHQYLARDIRYMQHPLVVLLLVTAGAHADVPAVLWAAIALYTASRAIGKAAGGFWASRVLRPFLPGRFGFQLLSPGLAGIALALNLQQVAGTWELAPTFFAIVIAGSIASDVLAVFVTREVGA